MKEITMSEVTNWLRINTLAQWKICEKANIHLQKRKVDDSRLQTVYTREQFGEFLLAANIIQVTDDKGKKYLVKKSTLKEL
jgi:hypothetical protein